MIFHNINKNILKLLFNKLFKRYLIGIRKKIKNLNMLI